VVEREDGSLLMDGMMAAEEAFDRLVFTQRPEMGDFSTLAGFVILRLGRIPVAGDSIEVQGWRLEVVDMEGRRVGKLLAMPTSRTGSSQRQDADRNRGTG
jgi:putative hemolysin